MVFQICAVLSWALDSSVSPTDPLSYKGVALGVIRTGAIQSLLLSSVELVKIRLQLQNNTVRSDQFRDPMNVARTILQREGLRGMYRGLTITVLRDTPTHGIYFWSEENMKEKLHPGLQKGGQETFGTVLMAGGLARVASSVFNYPLDVIKTRLQAQGTSYPTEYSGIANCFHKSMTEEGFGVLWRGFGTAVARSFIVNGAIFFAYETTLRCLFTNDSTNNTIESVQVENKQ